MDRMNYRIYRLLLLLFVVLDLHVLNVATGVADLGHKQNVTVMLYSYKNVIMDITTLYRITNMDVYDDSVSFTDNGFLTQYNGSYTIEVRSKINAVQMSTLHTCTKNHPAHEKLDIDVPKLYEGQFIRKYSKNVDFLRPEYWREIRIGLTGEKCEPDKSSSDERTRFDKACYDALDYIYGNHNYYNEFQTFFTVQWTPTKPQTCLAITYYHRSESDMEIIISLMSNVNNTLITSHTLEKHDDIKLLKISNMHLAEDQTYEIILKRKFGSTRNYYGSNPYLGNWFGILRINQCSDDDDEITTVSLCENGEHPKAFGVLESEAVWNKTAKSSPETICLNGGYELSDQTSTCVCPPGFKGQFCEQGCGANSYGADCKGICSMYKSKMCRGIFMCTKYGCTCPAGLTGPLCNDDCELGTYGAGCRKNCSSNCLTNICDQYTGICSEGCLPGYVPPNCLEKYPYLVNPPTLVSDKYEELDLRINFQPDNVKGGDGTTQMKYYQIFYLTGDMNHFKRFRSTLKLITDNNNGTPDVLSNLKADTEHTVGVLLIMDDGNFNNQDIVFGKYMTSCVQPQDTNYHIKLITEERSVKILWNKITPKHLECKIVKYVLTLTLNQSQIEVSDTKEIISSSKSFHRIDDLYPGYEYNIKMTPETSMGPMQTSPTYSFTFPITDDAVKINEIVTSAENGNIKVSWRLGSSYKREINVYKPVTCVIKYKINRILSCSLEETDQPWTSVTVFNRTYFEITNALPNSQYSIQVGVVVDKDINPVQHEKTVHVLTPETYPQTEPSVDPFHLPRITNSSVFVKWKINYAIDCSKLNGFITNFYVELLDTKHNLLQIRETKEDHILFDDLNPNSSYELKVFIQTNVGYNPERFLLTKVENLDLTPIKGLMVYKKSRKYRMAGIRWSYSNKNTSFDGYLIELNGNGTENATNVSNIPPEKCSAWPEYYCYTFYNLDPNTQYTCSIKPTYLDVSEDLDKSLISFNCIDDQVPGFPKNVHSIDVGDTYATLQWDIPWIFNGILKAFAMSGNEILPEDMDTRSPEIIELRTVPFKNEVPSYNYNLTGLKPGRTYSIEVFSVISTDFIRLSPPARITITTDNITP